MTTRIDRIQAVFLVILLAIGAGLVWGLPVEWILTTVDNTVTRTTQASERIVVLYDGTPLVESSRQRVFGTYTYRALDGKRVEVTNTQFADEALLNRPGGSQVWSARRPWRERITPLSMDQSKTEVWYVVHDGNFHGHAYLVGYDKLTRLKIGYVARSGFRTDAPPLEDQFSINGGNYRDVRHIGVFGGRLLNYVLTSEGLVRIDCDAREVKLVWQHPNPFSVRMCVVRDADGKVSESRLLVRTSDRVRVLDADGNEREAFAVPAELRDATLEWTPLPDGKALVWRFGNDNELFWLDASGVVRHEDVDLHRFGQRSSRKRTLFASLAVPIPALHAVNAAVQPLEPPARAKADSYWARLAWVLADMWPGLLVVVAVGVVLAWLCYRRQRKYGLPWTWVWTVLVFLFGLPAFFGYLALRRWPACLPCPNCGKAVPRDRPVCCACHSDFPAPATKGTEVFA